MLSSALAPRPSHNVLAQLTSPARQHAVPSLLYQRLSLLWSPSRMRWSSQSSAPFSYRLGASSCGKKSSLRRPENGKTQFNASLIDRDPPYLTSSARHSGEDAFFMAHIARSNRYV